MFAPAREVHQNASLTVLTCLTRRCLKISVQQKPKKSFEIYRLNISLLVSKLWRHVAYTFGTSRPFLSEV